MSEDTQEPCQDIIEKLYMEFAFRLRMVSIVYNAQSKMDATKFVHPKPSPISAIRQGPAETRTSWKVRSLAHLIYWL